MWRVPRMWEEGSCWIIGGGSSIYDVFGIPKELVDAVRNNQEPVSSFSSYMSVLHLQHVIGINAAFLLGTWIDILFFGDRRFYLLHQKQLRQYPRLKVTCNPNMEIYTDEERVKYMPRDHTRARGISTKTGHVSWNKNSGAAAISLAVQLGVRRIFLLGFDMQNGNNGERHFHTLYNTNKNTKPAKLPYARHLGGFDAIASDAKKLGIAIYNVSTYSALTQFKIITLQQALDYAQQEQTEKILVADSAT